MHSSRHPLCQHKSRFFWDETLEQFFQQSKTEILNSIRDGVRIFEINRPTCLTTDWSRTGIGLTLLQKHCESLFTTNHLCVPGHWKVACAGSRFTRPAESRYAQIEEETLAIKFGLISGRMFILGCPHLILAIDHKPLELIFNDRNLDEIKNPRILDIREQTLMYKFKAISIPEMPTVEQMECPESQCQRPSLQQLNQPT